MKFATFPSAAALAVALLAVSAHAGFPDGAEGNFNRRLPAGGNGQGRGNGNGNGNAKTKGPPPGADDDEIDVIVKWKNTGGRDELKDFAKDRKVKDISSRLKISALKTFRGNWNALANNPNIEAVEIDPEVHALPYFRGGNDEESSGQHRRLAEETPYGVEQVQADQLAGLDLPDPTQTKTICVVDTGYDVDHVDLPDGVDGYTPGGYLPEVWSSDGHGHGTHCAGTIGAIGNNEVGVTSVNPDPNKFSFFIGKGLTDSGSGTGSGVIEAVEACRANGADVISMSLGGGGFSSINADLYKDLYDNDILVIAAAGNGGNSALSYPASYDAVMSVAAVDINENKAGFSQYNEQVEIAGPGVGVKSTLPGNTYASWSGTSMATPHVAGVAALVWSHFPGCSAPQIRNVLLKTAKDKGTPGCDVEYGFGIVQAKAAYDLLTTGGCTAGGSLDGDGTAPVAGCARENLLPCSSHGECNDSNSCTHDSCNNPGINGFCVNSPIAGCTECGNGICEDGEGFFTCPDDCSCADDANCQCTDNPEGWYDIDGPTYDCAWYSQGSNCASYGDGYANNGVTANMACCVCDGGTKTPVEPPPQCLSDSDCSDGNFCNGEEVCIAGACVSGTAPTCDDGIACTDDTCTNNQCVYTPNNSRCDNGQFCDGSEICTSAGCQAGTPPDCGSGSCDEINDVCVSDPCDSNPCQNGGQCSSSGSGYTCSCQPGFTGSNCELDINECANNPCDANAVCTNTLGGYECACNQGYSGNGQVCSDINECSANTDDCVALAICSNNVGSFSCSCPAGYSGDGKASGSGCSDINECSANTNDCVSGATCNNNAGGYSCTCPSGYFGDGKASGTGCSDVNECATNNDCVALATCSNNAGSYTCTCPADYTGDGRVSGTGCNPVPPPGTCVDVTVEILTDYWGYETSWTISDASATTLMSGNQYGNQAYYDMTECLPNDANYVFTIYDSYGDGIYSPGYYKVSTNDGNNVLAQGWDFGSSEAKTFSLGEAGPGPCDQCADSPIGWYDADGPYYDCAWYGSGSSYCSSYGDYYANFGTTANQACCVCGGGESVCSTTAPSASSAFLASAKANARKKPNNGKKGEGAAKKKPGAKRCNKNRQCPSGKCMGSGYCASK